MAEDQEQRTEAPTAKRLEEAENRGQVAASAEFSQSVLLLAGLALVVACGASITEALRTAMRQALAATPRSDLDVRTAASVVTEAVLRAGPALFPILAGLTTLGALVGFMQVGFRFRSEVIGLNWGRVDPISGWRRVFNLRSVLRLAASVVKLAIIAAIVWGSSDGILQRLAELGRSTLPAAASTATSLAFQLLLRVGLATLLVGGADMAYQRWQRHRDLRMTKEEIKEELRTQQGSPEVKARIRRMQRLAAQRRMMQDVPKATVVVTNPTHVAVALRYRRPGGLEPADDAPVVVAKGQDLIARRIRETAVEAGVPIVENPPLARTLYRSTEIGRTVPPELYRAVAEVLAFVFRLRGRVGAR